MKEQREDSSLPAERPVCACTLVFLLCLPSRALIHLLFSLVQTQTMNQTMTHTIASNAALQQARIAIISANWHSDVVHQARDACARQLQTLGVAPARIHQIEVPGAFEIPLMARSWPNLASLTQ